MKTEFADLFELYNELLERLLRAEKERKDELNWYLWFNNDDAGETVIVKVVIFSGSVLYDKHFLLKDVAPEAQEELAKELERIEQALTSPAIVLTNDDAKVLHQTIREYINLGMTPDYRLIELRDLFNSGEIQATKESDVMIYEQIKSLFENYLHEHFKNLKADKVYKHKWSDNDFLSVEDFEKIALIIKTNPGLNFVEAVDKFVEIECPTLDLDDIEEFIDDFKCESDEGRKLLKANPWFTNEHFRKIFHENVEYQRNVTELISNEPLF